MDEPFDPAELLSGTSPDDPRESLVRRVVDGQAIAEALFTQETFAALGRAVGALDEQSLRNTLLATMFAYRAEDMSRPDFEAWVRAGFT